MANKLLEKWNNETSLQKNKTYRLEGMFIREVWDSLFSIFRYDKIGVCF